MTRKRMIGREVIAALEGLGCVQARQRGSHVRMRCAECFTTVPVHGGETLGIGLMNKIERDCEPCLGEGWLS